MDRVAWFIGKTDRSQNGSWSPLILHLIDVAACATAILLREPESTRLRMAKIFGFDWNEALPYLQFLIASHDIGKACPSFQCKLKVGPFLEELELHPPEGVIKHIHHGFVSQKALEEYLMKKGWEENFSSSAASAVGCHHGRKATSSELHIVDTDENAVGDENWEERRTELLSQLEQLFGNLLIPKNEIFSGADYMLLSGLTSFADWIGSNLAWFPFRTPHNTVNLDEYWKQSQAQAEEALNSIGWEHRHPLVNTPCEFETIFKKIPRPLQKTVAKVVRDVKEPTIILIEAPMGEGKTEAALFAHLELQRNLGHRGLYIALPTQATGNAMFKRTLEFLQQQGSDRSLDLQLLHGCTLLNDDFQKLCLTSIDDDNEETANVRAGEWFTHKKRGLLSEYGVGTIDQSLLGVLSVKHQFVRLWGLANRVVIFDEIHAYDTYTGTLLIELIKWLLALESSVVLLSATLPKNTREELAKIVGQNIKEDTAPYPRVTLYSKTRIDEYSFEADSNRVLPITLKAVSSDLNSLKIEIEKQLSTEGFGLILVNTVQRAQELYQLFDQGILLKEDDNIVGKILPTQTEIILFHARFPAEVRKQREDYVTSIFGKDGQRKGRKILIATQVVEQSLDLDFDWIISDLAPIDLILQRAGRLWRHQRSNRPLTEPVLLITGLDGSSPADFGEPLYWDVIYEEEILIRTWQLLKDKEKIFLPENIDEFVQDVYEKIDAEHLSKRIKKAQEKKEGECIANRIMAITCSIGSPEDYYWDSFSKNILADDENLNIHPSLKAKTRLGEPSVLVVPMSTYDQSNCESLLCLSLAKSLYQRSISISNQKVVRKMQENVEIPKNWKKSSLLRNCFPLWLTSDNCWKEDTSIRLDNELGLVFEEKES